MRRPVTVDKAVNRGPLTVEKAIIRRSLRVDKAVIRRPTSGQGGYPQAYQWTRRLSADL
jgi:hypothetical protein